jgi:CHAP domain
VTATAADVLATARSQLGTVERPPGSNRTPYGAAYGRDGEAWCAKFVWWVFRQSRGSALIPKTAFTPTLAQWFRDHGQWGTKPRPGALVFFDFPNDGLRRISHVALVEAVHPDGTIQTIEGNTSRGVRGSQRDGDGDWGPASRDALRTTVRALQAAWGAAVDGDWGPRTDATWAETRHRFGRGL